MSTKPKTPEGPQRKKPNETKIYHNDDEVRFIERRVRDGKYKNKQEYWRDLLRQDKLKNSR